MGGSDGREPVSPAEFDKLRQRIAKLEAANAELRKSTWALRGSEERFRLLFEQAPDAMFLCDLKGTFLDGNAAAETLVGYRKGDLIGKSLFQLDLLPTTQLLRAAKILATHLMGKASGPNEFTLKTGDGERRRVEIMGFPVRTGGRGMVLGVARDVTERHRSAAALRESEQRLRTLVEYAPEAIVMLDPKNGRFVDANRKAELLFGRRRQQLIGLDPIDVSPPTQPDGRRSDEAAREYLQQVARGEAPLFHWTHCHSDGTLIPCEVHLVRLPSAGAQLVRGSIIDITQRRVTEQALRESEAKFRALFEESHDAVYLSTLDGSLLEANRAALQLFGVTENGSADINLNDFYLDGNDRVAFQARLEHERAVKDHPMKLRRRDGSVRDCLLSATLRLGESGEIAGHQGIIRDVTERKRAEEALRMTQFALDRAAEPVFWINAEGAFVYVNGAACLTLGYRQQDLLHMSVFEVDQGVSKSGWAERWRMVKTSGALTLESRYLTKDGHRFPVEVALTHQVFEGEGYIFATARDISERKRAEEELRLQRAYFEELFQNLPEAVALIDKNGHVLRINREFTRLFGFSDDEVTGRTLDDFVSTAETRQEAVAVSRRAAGGEWFALESRRRAKDGRLIDVSILAAPIILDEQMVGAYGIYRDITPRKEAERALQESEARYRDMFENAAVSICLQDFSGAKRVLDELRKSGIEEVRTYLIEHPDTVREAASSVRVLDVNDATLRLFGATKKEEVLGQLTEMLVEGSLEVVRDELIALALGERHFEAGTIVRTLRGDPIDILIRLSIPSEPPDYENVLVTIVDVTERRRAEEALERANRLESLGLLAGGMAHDFNNLLAAIKGNAELMLLDASEDESSRGRLLEIDQAVRRATDLTDEMLAYAGRAKVDARPLDLTAILNGMEYQLRAVVPRKAALRYEYGTEVPRCLGDAGQVRRVITGLVANGAEALGDREGTVTVRTGVKRFDRDDLFDAALGQQLPEGVYAYLEVVDTGCGMDDPTRRRVFDPFFTTKAAGRGMGLAAVLGIVRSMRGAIRVESRVDRGTTVTIALPICARTAAEREPPAVDLTNWRGTGTVLVVDDERAVRSVTKRLLERCGFDVLTADDGITGVEAFREHAGRLRAVLLDFTMPGMNGDAAFSEMRRIRPDTPVVIMSGFAEDDAARRFPEDGPAAFIHKPFELTELFEKVSQVLTDSA